MQNLTNRSNFPAPRTLAEIRTSAFTHLANRAVFCDRFFDDDAARDAHGDLRRVCGEHKERYEDLLFEASLASDAVDAAASVARTSRRYPYGVEGEL